MGLEYEKFIIDWYVISAADIGYAIPPTFPSSNVVVEGVRTKDKKNNEF